MKIIMNVEINEGYEKWKQLFVSADDAREKYGIKVLAYGHPKDNENKVYQVLEIESMVDSSLVSTSGCMHGELLRLLYLLGSCATVLACLRSKLGLSPVCDLSFCC